jgi:Mg2+ and Co2+ transporter CorA
VRPRDEVDYSQFSNGEPMPGGAVSIDEPAAEDETTWERSAASAVSLGWTRFSGEMTRGLHRRLLERPVSEGQMTTQTVGIDLADVGPGVAWAFEFDENGHGRLLSADSTLDLMHGRRFVWVHLILADARTRHWLEGQDAVAPEAREVLLSQERHPRIEWRGDAMWGTFLDLRRDDEKPGEESTDLRFVIRPQFLLTARHHPVNSARMLHDQIAAGVTFEDSAALFEGLLVAAADSLGEATHKTAGQLDQIEDRVLSETLSDESAALLRLRRGMSRQERLMQAAQSLFSQIEQNRAETALPAYRDLCLRVKQRVGSFHADLHLQAERARLLQEEMAAQLVSATNRNLFALTLVTTVLLPPAFVTGFFGMNTKGMLFADSDYGTLYAAGLCVLAAGLVYVLIRRYRVPG